MPYKDKAKHRECQRRHYARKPKYYKDKARDRAAKNLALFVEFKSTLKCQRCPENDPCTFDFHHLDPKTKDGTLINRMVRLGWSWARVIAEIEKCICLCSNCHRKTHAHNVVWNISDLIIVPAEFRGVEQSGSSSDS